MNTETGHTIIVDFEFKKTDDSKLPLAIREMGAVAMNNETYEVTDFIQAKHIEIGNSFHLMFDTLCSFMERYSKNQLLFTTWGNQDDPILRKTCSYHDIHYELSNTDAQKVFGIKFNSKDGIGLKQALDLIKVDFQGKHHNALDDAKNVIPLLKVIRDKTIGSFNFLNEDGLNNMSAEHKINIVKDYLCRETINANKDKINIWKAAYSVGNICSFHFGNLSLQPVNNGSSYNLFLDGYNLCNVSKKWKTTNRYVIKMIKENVNFYKNDTLDKFILSLQQ